MSKHNYIEYTYVFLCTHGETHKRLVTLGSSRQKAGGWLEYKGRRETSLSLYTLYLLNLTTCTYAYSKNKLYTHTYRDTLHTNQNRVPSSGKKAGFWPSLAASGLVRKAASPKSQFPHP